MLYEAGEDRAVHYLDLSDEFVVLVVLRVWELINFYFVLLNLFHYLTRGESNQSKERANVNTQFMIRINAD